MSVINREQLAFVDMSHEFVGEKHGVNISFFLVNAPPGGGPELHRHNYDEVIVVQGGQATCVAGNEQREVKAGDIVVIPAGTPHRFVNSGNAPLRQIDIHASSKFVTEWLGSAVEVARPARLFQIDAQERGIDCTSIFTRLTKKARWSG
jgi:mannose-6-phosphate isomerase-like protein (cupin superfamily)